MIKYYYEYFQNSKVNSKRLFMRIIAKSIKKKPIKSYNILN